MDVHRQSATEVRQRLSHPVIDTDGHIIEFVPGLLDFLKQVAGPQGQRTILERLPGAEPAQLAPVEPRGMPPCERVPTRILAVAAFDPRYTPPGRRLRAMFSSDVGHWDVPDMGGVVPEAWEMVEDGVMGEADFHDFVFGNPVRLFTSLDRGFFDGTAIEGEVRAFLRRDV
jgi:hypothetical protein